MAPPWSDRSLQAVCPNCHTEFPLSEAMTAQLRDVLLADERARLDTERDRLERERSEQRAQLDAARQQLREQARQEARAAVEIEIADLRENVAATGNKLAAARKAELDIRAQNRELSDRIAEQELERVRAADEARKEAERTNQIQLRTKDEHIEQLVRTIDELKRKADAPSRLREGVPNQEIFADALKERFPYDRIEVIPRGQAGADVPHTVLTTNGQTCGLILWEAKRAAQWQPQWLKKLLNDMNDAGAEIGIIVSDALPPGVDGCDQIDGVWVTDYPTALSLAAALRYALLLVVGYRSANALRQDAAGRIFDYVATGTFATRVIELCRGIGRMEESLSKEKQAMTRIWATRAEELNRANGCMAAIIGELVGLGAEVPPEIHNELGWPGDTPVSAGTPPLLEGTWGQPAVGEAAKGAQA